MSVPTTGRTRAEHLAWAKERALEYLPGDVVSSASSFLSDLGKHPDLSDQKTLFAMQMLGGTIDAAECRKLIEGTN